VYVHVDETKEELGAKAARQAADFIMSALGEKGSANIILATGTSQFETLAYLVQVPEINWAQITMFHLDEYIGLPINHPASFRKYLMDRFVNRVSPLKNVYLIDGDTDNPAGECKRIGDIIRQHPIDVALIGIGENGHIAFNDPPADFNATDPYIIVELDEMCRKQQLGEGWFQSIEEIPNRAISMSIDQIMKSKHIIVSVPEKRKAAPVKRTLESTITSMCPASILQKHENCYLFLDRGSSSLLENYQ
jgi:glucosamine-6-phosphate deaminase